MGAIRRAAIVGVGLALLGLMPAGEARGQGAVGFAPGIGVIPDGVTLNAVPVVSADRRYVRLGVQPQFLSVVQIDTFPVPAAVSGGGGFGFGGAGGGFGGPGGPGGGLASVGLGPNASGAGTNAMAANPFDSPAGRGPGIDPYAQRGFSGDPLARATAAGTRRASAPPAPVRRPTGRRRGR